MAESVFRGPMVSAGSTLDSRVEPMDGANLIYQGTGIIDPRASPIKKDGLYPGRIGSWLTSAAVVLADNIPQASGTATLAALQNIVASTPMTLSAGALAQANGTTAGCPTLSPGIPIVPFGTTTPVNVIALDFGYTTGTTTTGGTSKTITVPDSTMFYPGQWIYVGGAGNSGKTLPLLTQVLTLATATTITVSAGALAAVTNAPIGNANMAGPLPGGALSGAAPNAYSARFRLGLGAFLNPQEAVTRCVSITGVSGSVGGSTNSFLVSGYDIYDQPMTCLMAGPVGAVTVISTKAFKYITSVTPVAGATDTTHNYSVGLSDTYGINLRSDRWEYLNICWNALTVTANTGWTGAVLTNPATNATGDVRGTYATQTTASNGSSVRLFMAMDIPVLNALFATPANPAPLVGVTQA
jgi:hypothetical protein